MRGKFKGQNELVLLVQRFHRRTEKVSYQHARQTVIILLRVHITVSHYQALCEQPSNHSQSA